IERRSSLAVVEPHSTPLQFFSETGIVGFLLYAAAVAAAIVAIRRRERAGALTALGLGAAVCLVHSFVDIDWDYVSVQGPLFLTVGALVSGPGTARRRLIPAAAAGVCALAALYSLASPWLATGRVDAALDAIASAHFATA